MKPSWTNGLPRCALDACEDYDGKRCRKTGEEPEGLCEPGVRAELARLDGHLKESVSEMLDLREAGNALLDALTYTRDRRLHDAWDEACLRLGRSCTPYLDRCPCDECSRKCADLANTCTLPEAAGIALAELVRFRPSLEDALAVDTVRKLVGDVEDFCQAPHYEAELADAVAPFKGKAERREWFAAERELLCRALSFANDGWRHQEFPPRPKKGDAGEGYQLLTSCLRCGTVVYVPAARLLSDGNRIECPKDGCGFAWRVCVFDGTVTLRSDAAPVSHFVTLASSASPKEVE